MEHDNELRIREKIRNLDNTSMPFDKELVWSSIRFHGTRPLRRVVLYYAAASLVLATAIVFYSIELTQRVALQARISELDLALEQARSAVKSKQPIPVATVAECPEAAQALVQQPRLAKRMKRAQPMMIAESETPVEQNTTLVSATDTEQRQATAVVSTPVEPNTTSIAGQPRITSTVILGRSLAATTNQASVKKGRLQMRLFRSEDEIPIGPSPSTPITLLAGTNNQ